MRQGRKENHMTEKEKAEINEMVEAAKIMAEHDPKSLTVAKAGFDALLARCEIEKASRCQEQRKIG